jgi:hypothetical protein
MIERLEHLAPSLVPRPSATKSEKAPTVLQAPKIQAGRSHTNGTTAPASALQHLTSASSGPHELFARVSDWARLHGGGRAVKIASGPSETSMVIRCRCADCPFTVKCRAQRDAGNWTVNVDNSVWSHGEATWKCCSKQHVDVHVCSQLPSVRTTVLQKPTADAWDTAELAKWMANSGFAEPKPKSQQGRTRVHLVKPGYVITVTARLDIMQLRPLHLQPVLRLELHPALAVLLPPVTIVLLPQLHPALAELLPPVTIVLLL